MATGVPHAIGSATWRHRTGSLRASRSARDGRDSKCSGTKYAGDAMGVIPDMEEAVQSHARRCPRMRGARLGAIMAAGGLAELGRNPTATT